MAFPRWYFIVTDLAGNPKGQLHRTVTERKVSLPLNGLPTFSAQMPLDHPRAAFLMSGAALIKAYRVPAAGAGWFPGGIVPPIFVGPVVGLEESGTGEGGTITIQAAGGGWRLKRRLLGMAFSGGRGVGFFAGAPLAQLDKGVIASLMITVLNSTAPTGVSIGALGASSNGYVGPLYWKNAWDAIVELGPGTLNGYDFEVVPLEPSGAWPNTIIGQFKTYGTLGASRPNAIFEYGMGKRNVQKYKRVIDMNGMANIVYTQPQGFPDAVAPGDLPTISFDAASYATYGVLEDAPQADLAVQAMRQQLGDEHVRVRKAPRQQVEMEPMEGVTPDFQTDYIVGDVVTARAKVRNSMRLNGLVRVYGADFAINKEGREAVTLTLINDS